MNKNNFIDVLKVGTFKRDSDQVFDVREFNGRKVLSFLGISKIRYDSVNKRPINQYYKVSIWGKGADAAEKILKRGTMVHVEGYVNIKNQKQSDNSYRTFVDIVANNWSVVNYPQDNNHQSSEAQASSNSEQSESAPPAVTPPSNQELEEVPF